MSADQSLQSAGVEEGSTLLLVSGACEVNGHVAVVRWSKQVKTIICTKQMTVAELKDVCRKLGCRPNFTKLTHNGSELEDSSIVLDCVSDTRPEFLIEKPGKPSEARDFDVIVKTLTGKNFSIALNAALTVEDIKEIISEHEGYPMDIIRLICAGHGLCDEETVEQLRMTTESVIHVVLRLR